MLDKTVLVAGGAGFLGSHLCKMLLDRGEKVICLDNLYTGSRENINEMLGDDAFTFVEKDIVNPLSIEKVDEIYNLACPASPVHYQSNPIQTTKTSVIGTLNLLELARVSGAKILQASTSEVYGDPDVHPQPESYRGSVNPIGIRACYDEGKRCAETLMFDYHRQYSVKIKVMRIFNTYGPKMNPEDGRVVSNFIVQALNGDDITVYGKGGQTRSFCYVDDLIDGMVKLMDSQDDITGPINIGNPIEFTILELAQRVLELTGASSKLVYSSLPQDDPLQRRPDIDLAKKILNWVPEIGLDEGLLKTIEYFKNVIQSRVS